MTRATLLALADRVEALTGPCRETDAEIRAGIECDTTAEYVANDDGSVSVYANKRKTDRLISQCYTASLDAAMTLAEGREWTVQNAAEPMAIVSGIERYVCAATPALALTAAALRARAMMETE